MDTARMPRSSHTALLAGALALLTLAPERSLASPAPPSPRVVAPVDEARRTSLRDALPAFARPELEAGRVAPQTRLEGMALVFGRTVAQEAELSALIAAQHDPASPRYRRWLTPEDLAARFGVAPSDVAAATAWLGSHGLAVGGLSRAGDVLRFSGTVGQVEAALGTELHTYRHGDRLDFAPAADPSIPTALSPLVHSVRGLTSARPRPRLLPAEPQFTSAQTSSHYLTPADVVVIYDIGLAYQKGIDGTGQRIVVVGQSSVDVTDVEHFQAAAGLAVRDPVLTLVPGSGTAVAKTGDQAESDLDLEYAGGIATGATIEFVYVGNGSNQSVFDAVLYAVDQDLAPVISMSYGICEADLAQSDFSTLESLLKEAAAQGQSLVVSSGDSGSTDCQGVSGLTAAVQQSLAVDYPASSQYATAIGGTEFSADAVAAANTTYWKQASGGTDVIGSALSYISEEVWNDDDTTTFAAGGGGVSASIPRPSWQAGVPGIPSGSTRLVPDVSLDASPSRAPYLYCSSDSSTGITGSCANGFRDSASKYLTAAGGTSFGAPIFAGMLALVNQKIAAGGLGVAAADLYPLAASAATYASAFHDITVGGNACPGGASGCSTAGAGSYAAGTGYDEASGLGSVDFANLLAAWAGASPAFSVSAASATVALGASGTSTVTVVPEFGYAGTIAWTITASPALSGGCLSLPKTAISSADPVTASLTIHASSSLCGAASLAASAAGRLGGRGAGGGSRPASGAGPVLAAALLGLGAIARRRRAPLLAAAVLALAACGGSTGSGSSTPAKGTYTVTIVGKDTVTPTITATATMTLTID